MPPKKVPSRRAAWDIVTHFFLKKNNQRNRSKAALEHRVKLASLTKRSKMMVTLFGLIAKDK
jgi:hypothetical protein